MVPWISKESFKDGLNSKEEYCGMAGRTLQKSCCFGGFEVLVTWQRPRPFVRNLRKSHKKAGFSIVLENNPSLVFN
jgi:hypothetical protein